MELLLGWVFLRFLDALGNLFSFQIPALFLRFLVPACWYRLAKIVEWRVGSFSSRELSLTALAFAKAGQLDEALIVALLRAVGPLLGECNAQDLANTAWSF